MIRRAITVAVMSALLLAMPQLTSSAAAGPMQTAAACYDGHIVAYVTGGPGSVYLPSSTGYYTTTSRCQDINFTNRSSSGANIQTLIRVCFVSAGYCNTWKYYNWQPGVDWIVVASNVLDGTRFRLEFSFYESSWGTRYGNLIAF